MIEEDIRKNLESIARIIKRANITKNFALVFAECDSLKEQENYVEKLNQECSEEGIELTEVKLLSRPPVKRLFDVIKEHLEEKFGNHFPEKLGIQVTGLELSILLDEDEQAPAVLQILNMNRESYYKDLPFPFVFWLPQYACIKVANAAPDFWAYRVGTPTFYPDKITGGPLPGNIEEGKDITVWQDKAAQIPVLERLLNAHQSTEVLINLLIKSGEAYAYIGNTEKARQKYEQAIIENQENNIDPQWVAEAYNKLGIIYSDMGEGKEHLNKAVESLRKYLKIVELTGRTDRLTGGYNHLGLVYDRHKEYDQALKSYEEALRISRKYGHRKADGDILGNMGLLYRKQKKYKDALKMHQQALAISRELDDIQSEALDLSNIGLIYYEQTAYKDAVDYFKQALFNNAKTGHKLEEMNQLIHLGDAWKSLGNFSRALENYNSAKAIAEDININIFAVFDRIAVLFSSGAFNNDGQGILLLEEAIEKSRQLQKADKELLYWGKLCTLYRIRNEIAEKNKCLMHMAGILDKQIRQSEDRDEKIGHYEELSKIYEELDKEKELKVCRQKLEELNYLQIIAWSEPMVNMEDSQPIFQVGKTYNLNLQIVQILPKHTLIYQGKIPPFKKEQKISKVIETPPLEGRRISEEKAKPIEATKNSDKILNDNIPKGNIETGIKETSIQPEIDYNKQDYYSLTEKGHREKIDEIISPSPPPYMSDPFATAVSFRFKSPGIGFDRATTDVLLSKDNISDIGSIAITSKSPGSHQISVSVRVKTSGYKNNFKIPYQAATNAYNFVHMDFKRNNGTAFPRQWSDEDDKWTAHKRETHPNGTVGFSLLKDSPVVESRDNQTVPVSPPESAASAFNLSNTVFNLQYRAKKEGMVGRDDALKRVREQLIAGKPAAIGHTAAFQGLGGLGKTQLAVEYAHKFRDEYPNGVIWLNADQEMEPQLIQIAKQAKWISSESKPSDILDVAKQRLKTWSECLIIFDNVEKQEDIEAFFPEADAEPHLLLTSRAPQKDFVPVPIDLLDKNLSLQLLLKESGRDIDDLPKEEQTAALEIAGSLDGLPLAIEIAGAYLNHIPDCTFQNYKAILDDNFNKAMKGDLLSSFTKHEKNLFLTLQVSQPVLDRAPLLQEILDLLAWSGSSFMGISLMAAILEKKETELYHPLGLGKSLRLLHKAEEGERYEIHRLVRQVRQEQFPIIGRIQWIKDVCQRLGNWFEERRREFTNLPAFEAEIDHLTEWLRHVKPHSKNHVCRLTWLQAYPPYHWGKYHEAHRLLQSAFFLIESLPDSDQELKANILNDLGVNNGSLGNYKGALKYEERALEIRRQLFGEQHPDTADSLNNVGGTYGGLGNHKEALRYKERALKIFRQLFGEQHPDTAASLNNVGKTYSDFGNHKEALKYKERALGIRRQLFGEQHPDTADSLNNVGKTYSDLGNYIEALSYVKQAFEIRSQIFGEYHPDTADSFYGYVYSLMKLRKFKEASERLNNYLKNLPHEHPNYDKLVALSQSIQQESVKSGFRPPSAKKKGKKKKKR